MPSSNRSRLHPAARPLWVVVLVLACAGCLFGGRKRAPEPPPQVAAAPPALRTIDLTLVGTAEMNNNNAVRVRIYQLAGDAAFRQAAPAPFWADDERLLGADLINRQELLLYPGETRPLQLTPPDNVQFIGVAADFYQPHEEGWRTLHPVAPLRGGGLRITLEADRLTNN